MNTKTLAVLLIAIATQGASIPMNKGMKDAAIKSVSSQLKDPYSAQFSDMTASDQSLSGGIVVCGRVNAKNSYGAYSGSVPFRAGMMVVKDRDGKTVYYSPGAIISGHEDGDEERFFGVATDCKPY